MSKEAQVTEGLPRRQALCGMVALGVLGPAALAACSSNAPVGQQPAPASTTGGASEPPASEPAASAPAAAAPGALAKLAEIPQGGGKVVVGPAGAPILLVHGNDGTVKAFSARCTHQGATVGAPENGVITCPLHNSKFSAADGSVKKGPAQTPLPAVPVKVQGANVVLG